MGTAGAYQQPGNGGDGFWTDISGVYAGYCGGGAGMTIANGTAGAVQAGAGGGGPQNGSCNGRPNSGGGGGETNWVAGNGGSGIVIIRYSTGSTAAPPEFDAVSCSHASDNISVGFNAEDATTYTIQYRNSLTAGDWQKLEDVSSGSARPVVVTDDTTGIRQRCYRIVSPATP